MSLPTKPMPTQSRAPIEMKLLPGIDMTKSTAMTPEALAHLGDGLIAYIKAIRSEDLPALYPQAPELEPGLQLFSLHAADGTPIMITDSREAAVANAWSQELETVSVH
jgi:hypothetical protein